MIKVYSVPSEADLAVLRSIFDSEEIPYFVRNDSFGSIVPGPQIENYNTKAIMVSEQYEQQAREIVRMYESETVESRPAVSILDRIRMVLETVLFSWFAPGRARNKTEKES
jgi:hypothetical protein